MALVPRLLGLHGSGHGHAPGHGHGSSHGHHDGLEAGHDADHAHASGTLHQPRAYDAVGTVMFAGRRPAVYRQLAAMAGIRPGDRVLDIACGTGALTRAAALVAGPTGHVIGVDLAPEMVAYARDRSRIRRGAPIEYRAADAANLPLPEAGVDVVVSALGWHHLPDATRADAWAEALRVLRPGGRLLIAEFRAPGLTAGRAIAHHVFGPAMAVDHSARLLDEARAAGASRPRLVRRRPMFICLLAERPTD